MSLTTTSGAPHLSFSEQEQKTNGGYENAFQNTDIDKLEPRAQY